MTTGGQLAFVSEPIKPITTSVDVQVMASGSPGLPAEFIWRDEPLKIVAIVRSWRETGPCRHSRTEKYVRKHWYEVETSNGKRARIYFERRPRDHHRTRRWWLFSLEE